jgi:hypothetical protein
MHAGDLEKRQSNRIDDTRTAGDNRRANHCRAQRMRATKSESCRRGGTRARLISWANKNDYRNIAGSLGYVLALLGSIDDPGQ